MDGPVVEQKSHIAHGQCAQRDDPRCGAQLLRDAARRNEQQHQPVHCRQCPIAEQQFAHAPQQLWADAFELRLDQRVVPQQKDEDEGHLFVWHEQQAEQAHRAVGRKGHLHAALHADRGNEQAGCGRCNEHQHRHHGPQQHQRDAQRRRHAAVGHSPAAAALHGSSQRTGWFSASSGSTAWRRPRIMMLSMSDLFSLTSSIP